MIKIYNLLIINSLVHLFQDVIYVKTSEMTSGNTLIHTAVHTAVTICDSDQLCKHSNSINTAVTICDSDHLCEHLQR